MNLPRQFPSQLLVYISLFKTCQLLSTSFFPSCPNSILKSMKGTCFLNFITSFLLLVSMAYSAMEVTNITADQTALLALKAHLTDPHNVLANNWSTTASVCSWIGVTCGAPRYRVSGLNLSHMSLSGYIPSEIGNLSFLEYLDFGFNELSGEIPTDIFNHLPELRGIYFSRNRLSGMLLPFFFNF